MRNFKYVILAIHIVAVVSAIVYTLVSDHAVTGKGFYKCEQFGNSVYLAEDAGNYSLLYKGDYTGNVSSLYKSNQDESKVTMVDFNIADDVYVLKHVGNIYTVKKLSEENLSGISKTKPFILRDIEAITDFDINLSDNVAYITAIVNDSRSVNVYVYSLSNLAPVGSPESELQSEEVPLDYPVTYRYDSVDGIVRNAYFDGLNIITESRPVSENSINPYGYAGNLSLTVGQSLKVNTNVLLILFAYGLIGVLLIVLITRIIERRNRFADLIILNEIFILTVMALSVFMLSNVPLAIGWAVIASIANILILWLENRDIRVLCENMERISSGNLELEKPKGSSLETTLLWRGMNEIKILYEEYKYIQDTTTAAVLRFLPHNIGAMFKCNSLDGIKPGDSVMIDGTFMTLRTKKGITNNLISKTEDYEKKAGGVLLTGECSTSEIRMMFSKSASDPVDLGLRFFSEMEDDSACSLYFKDIFNFSVVGTHTKSILNIKSVQMDTMERMAEWFSDMGLRMVISEEVKQLSSAIKSPLRYIGYCYIEGEKKSFYEVLNAYGEKTRSDRLRCLENFDRALTLLYQDNYYLARTAFSDILKVDPGDELARWYLFICEKHLNNPDLPDKSCALDPKN